MAGPLTGLTVLDFSWGQSGSVAGMVLSDFGAEVIKVEPPTGDPFRKEPSWIHWNRGKKGIVIDLKTPEGQQQAQRLAERADVVLETFRPGVTKRMGIDYETLSRINPRLIYTSITGFGQKGPLSHIKGYDGIVAARIGRMLEIQGGPQREGPVYTAVMIGTWAASQAAVRGTLAALRIRERTGLGEWVQTSLLQGIFAYDHELLNHQLSHKDPVKFPINTTAVLRRAPSLSYLPARTKDGKWIQMANLIDRLFKSFIRAIGLWSIYRDERFKDAPNLTIENREILRDMILKQMQTKTLDEWMEIFRADGDVAAEPVVHALEGMKHGQFVYNKHTTEVDDPRVGKMTQLNVLVKMTKTPGEVQGPAPALGQHTADVLAGLSKERIPAAVAGGAQAVAYPKMPFEGVTILELAGVVAAPTAAALFAELGARVIKIEPPEGDPVRTLGGGLGNGSVRTTAGKESIMMDLKHEEAQEILKKLAARANVLMHNYRPGVPERLGMDYETLSKVNPKLVYHYAGAYGSEGPDHKRPAAHPIPGALFGGALRQAGMGMPPPPETPLTHDELKEVSRRIFRGNTSNPDENTGMGIATGMALGLYAQEKMGIGQYIESSMIQANAYANAQEAYDYAGRPSYAIPDAAVYGLHALYRLYKTKKGWVFLAVMFQDEWETFCKAVGREELASDANYKTEKDRASHDIELAEEVGAIMKTRTAAEWEEFLPSQDIACVQADELTMGDFLWHHPHMVQNNYIREADRAHLRFGRHVRTAAMIEFAHMSTDNGTGCLGGEHTDSIMRELGYSDEQIKDLRERQIIFSEERKVIFEDEGAHASTH